MLRVDGACTSVSSQAAAGVAGTESGYSSEPDDGGDGEMSATVYLALNDECSFEDYPDGLRIEVFITDQARSEFIQSQFDFGDWQTRDLPVQS